eukprot:s3693_g5.t1
MCRSATTRRPMSGLRRDTTSSASSMTPSSDVKSTLSGSTASHGPRFKRYRVQSSGIKEAPEENISMAEEECITVEDCNFNSCDTAWQSPTLAPHAPLLAKRAGKIG